MTEWERCRPWIEAALEHSIGGWTVDELKAEPSVKLFAGERAALVVQLADYPLGKAVESIAAGGDGDEIVSVLVPMAEAWGQERGAVRAHLVGRLGWSRRMKSSGYEPLYTVLAKELR